MSCDQYRVRSPLLLLKTKGKASQKQNLVTFLMTLYFCLSVTRFDALFLLFFGIMHTQSSSSRGCWATASDQSVFNARRNSLRQASASTAASEAEMNNYSKKQMYCRNVKYCIMHRERLLGFTLMERNHTPSPTISR